jgi:hypothetical protein
MGADSRGHVVVSVNHIARTQRVPIGFWAQERIADTYQTASSGGSRLSTEARTSGRSTRSWPFQVRLLVATRQGTAGGIHLLPMRSKG